MAGIDAILFNFIAEISKKKALEAHKTLGEGAFIPMEIKCRVSI